MHDSLEISGTNQSLYLFTAVIYVNNCNKIITWWSFNDESNFAPQEASVAKWGWGFEKTKDLVSEHMTQPLHSWV